jgi:hypothetical protein
MSADVEEESTPAPAQKFIDERILAVLRKAVHNRVSRGRAENVGATQRCGRMREGNTRRAGEGKSQE